MRAIFVAMVVTAATAAPATALTMIPVSVPISSGSGETVFFELTASDPSHTLLTFTVETKGPVSESISVVFDVAIVSADEISDPDHLVKLHLPGPPSDRLVVAFDGDSRARFEVRLAEKPSGVAFLTGDRLEAPAAIASLEPDSIGNAVPEPTGALLFGVGLVLFARSRGRHRAARPG